MLKKQDLIVVVAKDIPRGLLDNRLYIKEVVYWNVPDVFETDGGKAIRKVLEKIMKKCDKLNAELGAKETCLWE